MSGWILLPEWFLYILLGAMALLGAGPFIVILYKSPKQVKTFIKAWLRKRDTIVVARGDQTLDIVAPEITKTGHLRVSSKEIYNPLASHNPITTKKYFWRKTGIPAFVADARKVIYTSFDTLTAIEVVERLANKLNVPVAVKEWAEKLKVDITSKKLIVDEKTGQPLAVKKTISRHALLKLSPAKLKEYFAGAVDHDAQTVLYDMAVQEGMEMAGKQYLKIGLMFFGVGIFIISLVALLSVVMA
ncbi:MAG: hypothetical protein KAV41_03500 [Candidatus Pacebacteria bacterium]|nr:hypothetical protein [Candidatus Paceibacterota bacterium]